MAIAAETAQLPDDTRFYCGHEYTDANIRFAKTIEPNNKALAARAEEVAELLAAGKPTIPATIGAEKAANPFLRADVPKSRKRRPCRQSGLESVRGNPRAQKPLLTARPPRRPDRRAVIRLLDLEAASGGRAFPRNLSRHHYRFVRGRPAATRGSTAIYFLLARGERSHWHRVDAAEVWHWYAGAPLALEIARRRDGERLRSATILPPASVRRRRAGSCLAGRASSANGRCAAARSRRVRLREI